MDHEPYVNNFILPPSWEQCKRMDQGGFLSTMPLDYINFDYRTHQFHTMVYNKSLIFRNSDYSHPFNPRITVTFG